MVCTGTPRYSLTSWTDHNRSSICSSITLSSHVFLTALSLVCLPLGVLAGSRGGRGGEDTFAVGGPSRADIAPVADHQGGLGVLVGEQVGLEGGQVQGPAAVSGLGDQGLRATSSPTQDAEGDRVAARLRREVAPEPEHVHPSAEQLIRIRTRCAVRTGACRCGGPGAAGQRAGGSAEPPAGRVVARIRRWCGLSVPLVSVADLVAYLAR